MAGKELLFWFVWRQVVSSERAARTCLSPGCPLDRPSLVLILKISSLFLKLVCCSLTLKVPRNGWVPGWGPVGVSGHWDMLLEGTEGHPSFSLSLTHSAMRQMVSFPGPNNHGWKPLRLRTKVDYLSF